MPGNCVPASTLVGYHYTYHTKQKTEQVVEWNWENPDTVLFSLCVVQQELCC